MALYRGKHTGCANREQTLYGEMVDFHAEPEIVALRFNFPPTSTVGFFQHSLSGGIVLRG